MFLLSWKSWYDHACLHTSLQAATIMYYILFFIRKLYKNITFSLRTILSRFSWKSRFSWIIAGFLEYCQFSWILLVFLNTSQFSWILADFLYICRFPWILPNFFKFFYKILLFLWKWSNFLIFGRYDKYFESDFFWLYFIIYGQKLNSYKQFLQKDQLLLWSWYFI